jgi:cytidylate kinase
MSVVTISASYGAGGSEIGPDVAERLGLPFVDRAIPVTVAERLGVSLAAAEAQDGKSEGGAWWMLSSIAMVPDLSGAGALAYVEAPSEGAFREQTEAVLHEIEAGSGGVILGRAGAVVLADCAAALHVRLDGPENRRVALAARSRGISEEEARRELRDSDAARSGYVKHFYRCDATSPKLYHLVIDTTAVPWDAATDLVVHAARSRGIG